MQWRGNSLALSSLTYMCLAAAADMMASMLTLSAACKSACDTPLQAPAALSAGTSSPAPALLPNPIDALESNGGQRGVCGPKMTLPAPSVEQ